MLIDRNLLINNPESKVYNTTWLYRENIKKNYKITTKYIPIKLRLL